MNKISNWKKPGGKLGMVVLGGLIGGGLIVLNKILPFLISLTTNVITLGMLIIVLAGLGFLVTSKDVRRIVSTTYFLIMRKITGLIIELDPIAIIERKIVQMENKIEEIQGHMHSLKGHNIYMERSIEDKKKELESTISLAKQYREMGQIADSAVHDRQVIRLTEVIQTMTKRLEESKNWFSVLKQLEHAAQLTVLDTKNEVDIRKEEYVTIKKQQKVFRGIMSIIKGNPDEMQMFNDAMEHIQRSITDALGEMTDVISNSAGLLYQIKAENGAATARVNELIEKFTQQGITGILNSSKSSPEPILINKKLDTNKQTFKQYLQ